jgi:hypothetical protein
LKDAINEALRDWVTNVHDTYYLLGSALGPHPYPLMVRDFQSVIGREAREQILSVTGKLPRALVACVGGGSNAIGLFHPFVGDEDVRLIGVSLAVRIGDAVVEAVERAPAEAQVALLHKLRVLRGEMVLLSPIAVLAECPEVLELVTAVPILWNPVIHLKCHSVLSAAKAVPANVTSNTVVAARVRIMGSFLTPVGRGFAPRLPVLKLPLEAFTRDYATKIARNAPLAVRAARRLSLQAATHDDEARIRGLADREWEVIHASDDYVEGPRAFAEKRPPRWQGR